MKIWTIQCRHSTSVLVNHAILYVRFTQQFYGMMLGNHLSHLRRCYSNKMKNSNTFERWKIKLRIATLASKGSAEYNKTWHGVCETKKLGTTALDSLSNRKYIWKRSLCNEIWLIPQKNSIMSSGEQIAYLTVFVLNTPIPIYWNSENDLEWLILVETRNF